MQKLRAIGVPLRVLVVTDSTGAGRLASLPASESAGICQVLEVGNIEAGLHSLEKQSA